MEIKFMEINTHDKVFYGNKFVILWCYDMCLVISKINIQYIYANQHILYDNKTNLSYCNGDDNDNEKYICVIIKKNQKICQIKSPQIWYSISEFQTILWSSHFRTFGRKPLSRRRLWRMTSWRIFLQVRWTQTKQ